MATVELITHSRQSSFKACRRQHWYAYELGFRPKLDAKALRMGSAHHAGLEALGKGRGLEAACEAARAFYLDVPEFADPWQWSIECETVLRLLCGYDWRWANDELENIATEQAFQIPLRNPETGKTTPLFRLAGKIDGIVRLPDGRLAVKESKTTSDDLSSDADVWRRLRIDHQISLYVYAARKLGYPVECVLYDVTRKPGIKPEAVPVLDELGAKIVLDRQGGRVRTKTGDWRQTGSKEDGYVLQTRPMTPEEWGEKLSNDIAARPDYYFARVPVARLDQDIDEYEADLWDIQQTIREAQRNGRHFRTVNKNTCDFCAYFDICTNGFNPATDALPEKFERVTDLHPELERPTYGNSSNSPETTSPATAESACTTVA